MIDLLVSGTAIYCIDQYSKGLAMAQASDRVLVARPVIAISGVASTKPIFGSEGARTLLFLLWLSAFVGAIALLQSPSLPSSRTSAVGLGLAVGGAAGNMTDIVRSGSVRDFIAIGWWPRFNLADVAILGGLGLSFLVG